METSIQSPQAFNAKRDLYYTNDHEWIDFQGSVAYIGVCAFKLKGVKRIKKIEFSEDNSKKCGEVVSIFYDDYKIDVYMPVNGKIISMNQALLSGNKNIVLQAPETAGYIALILPFFL